MLFLPGTIAASTHNATKIYEEDKRHLEEDIGSPAAYERVLHKLDNEVRDVINEDEAELMQEANKIASIQKKINRKEKEYVELEQELAEEELSKAEDQDKKLEKAEEKLMKLELGHDDESPVKEKIEEVLHDVKEGVKDAFDKTADWAHLMFASKKELDAREKMIERGEEPQDAFSKDTDVTDEPADSMAEEKLRAAAKRIEELRRQISEKRTTMMNEDDKLLRKEAEKLEQLHQQLEEEIRLYNEIQANLTDDLAYETRICEEKKKVKELQQRE